MKPNFGHQLMRVFSRQKVGWQIHDYFAEGISFGDNVRMIFRDCSESMGAEKPANAGDLLATRSDLRYKVAAYN